MKIKIAEHAGFCFGVKEALEKTKKTIEQNKGKDIKIYTCGPLIHNRTVTGELREQGVVEIESPAEAERGSIVIVRSHGEPERFYQQAKDRELCIVDATCPFVSKIHDLVREASLKGRNVIVVGDATHPEVIGTTGWAGDHCLVIDTLEMAKKIELDHITLVAQTTITEELWKSIADCFMKNKEDVIALHTICNATTERQRSCETLAKESDAMIVIGDPKSANSTKLYEIASKYCEKTHFVDTPADLPLKELAKCDTIGVAAGASTPERIIKEVIATMSEIFTEKELKSQDAAVNTAVEDDEEEEFNMMHEFMEQIDKSLRLPNRGEIVEGEIVQVTSREIVVNLGCKKDGIIPKDELVLEGEQDLNVLYKEGDVIQAKVIKTDDGDGNILLSRKKLEVIEHWDEINDALDNKLVVNAKVVKEVKGGVIAMYKEVSGFIPMSQLSDKFVEKADEFIGKTLPVKVSRVDQKRNKAVFSHKAYLAEEKQKKVQEIWDALSVGDVVEGVVMRFTDYGAFVDIGGLDGLLHISEISWGKLKHPQEALEIGEKVQVKILSMNSEKGKISLGLKQNQPEPWMIIDEKYQIGQVIEGKVVQIKEYGAFVELEPGLDGLVHISEIAHKRVTNIADELTVGQEVQAKILEIDKERRRISLSIKETIEPSLFDDAAEAVEDAVEAATDAVKEVAETVADKIEEIVEDVKEKIED